MGGEMGGEGEGEVCSKFNNGVFNKQNVIFFLRTFSNFKFLVYCIRQ